MLKRFLLLALMVAMPVASLVRAQDALAAQDLQSKAYLTLIEGDEFLKQNAPDKALDAYGRALTMYQKIKELDPNYNPRIIGYRLTYCANKARELEAQLKKERGMTSAEAYQQLETLKMTLAALESDASGLRKKLLDAESASGRAEAEIKKREERITALEQDAAAASAALRRMADAQAAAEQAATNQVAALLKQLGALQGELQKARAEQAEAAKTQVDAEAGQARFEEAVGALQQEVKVARADLENARKAEAVYQARIAELEEVADPARKETAALQAKITGLEEKLRALEQDRESELKQVADQKEAASALEARLNEMEAAMESTIAKRLEAATNQVKSLEATLAEELAVRVKAETEAREQKRQREDQAARLEALEQAAADPASITAEMERLRAHHAEQMAEQEKRLADAAEQVATMRAQMEATAAKSAADAEIINRMGRSTNSLVARLEVAETTIHEMKEQVRRAVDESLSLLRERDDLSAKLEEASGRYTAEIEAHRVTREEAAKVLQSTREEGGKSLAAVRAELDAAVKSGSELAAETNRLAQVRAGLEQTNETMRVTMEGMKKDFLDEQARAGELSKAVEEATRQRMDIEVQLANTNQVLAATKESMRVLEQEAARKLTEQEGSLRQAREQLDVLMGREKDLLARVEALTAESAAQKEELSAAGQAAENASKRETELVRQLEGEKGRTQGLVKELAGLRAELDGVKAELGSRSNALKLAEELAARDAKKIEGQTRQIDEKTKEVAQLRKDLKDRTAQLKQLAEQARQFMSNVKVPDDLDAPKDAPAKP
jgi:chromosome segregation ATPase